MSCLRGAPKTASVIKHVVGFSQSSSPPCMASFCPRSHHLRGVLSLILQGCTKHIFLGTIPQLWCYLCLPCLTTLNFHCYAQSKQTQSLLMLLSFSLLMLSLTVVGVMARTQVICHFISGVE